MMVRVLGLLVLMATLVHCGDSNSSMHSEDVTIAKDSTQPLDTSASDIQAADSNTSPDIPALLDAQSPEDTAPSDLWVQDTAIADTAIDDTNLQDTNPVDVELEDVLLEDTFIEDTTPEDTAPVPAALRLAAPLSTAMSMSQTPHFKVVYQGDVDGAEIEICKDLACTDILTTFQINGTEGHAPSALEPGVYYWRAKATLNQEAVTGSSVVWQFWIGHGNSDNSASFGSFFDVNLDGYTDAIVGACGLSTCTEKVYIHLGGPNGLAVLPQTTLEYAPVPFFGRVVSTAGDINGDGYPDVIVGTQLADSALVFLGGPDGIAELPDQTWSIAGAFFGFSVAPAGDVNGDGFGDVIVGAMLANSAFLYYGGPKGPGVAPDFPLSCPGAGACGTAVAGAGDINGDGYGDLLVGDGAGDKAYIWHGGPDGPNFEPNTTLEGIGLFGTSVDIAGDVNGDGFADVVVGAPEENTSYVYLGSSDGVKSINKIPLAGGASNGISVATAGDVNGDGLMDVITGSKYIARVYLGDLATGVNQMPIQIVGNTAAFADTVAGLGDTNGDGFGDILIGATDQDNAGLFLGNADGVSTIANVTIHAEGDAPGYGYSVAQLWGTGGNNLWNRHQERPRLTLSIRL